MPSPPWTNPDQDEFLESRLSDFLAAQRDKTTTNFWKIIYRDFFEKWADPEDEIPAVTVPKKRKGKGRVVVPNQTHTEWVQKRKNQINHWFYNRRHGTNSRRPTVCLSNSAGHSNSRMLSELNLYSKKYYDTRVRAVAAEAWKVAQATPDHPPQISVINKCLTQCWEDESEEVKQEIREEYMRLKEEKNQPSAPLNLASPTAEDYAAAQAVMPPKVKAFMVEMKRETGFVFTVLAGGPDPKRPGRMRVLAFHEGVDRFDQRFGSAYASFSSNVLEPFQKFLYNVKFSEEEIAERFINDEDPDSVEVKEPPLKRQKADEEETPTLPPTVPVLGTSATTAPSAPTTSSLPNAPATTTPAATPATSEGVLIPSAPQPLAAPSSLATGPSAPTQPVPVLPLAAAPINTGAMTMNDDDSVNMLPPTTRPFSFTELEDSATGEMEELDNTNEWERPQASTLYYNHHDNYYGYGYNTNAYYPSTTAHFNVGHADPFWVGILPQDTRIAPSMSMPLPAPQTFAHPALTFPGTTASTTDLPSETPASDPPVTLPGTTASTAVSPSATSASDPPLTLPGTTASTAVSPSSTLPLDPPFTLPGTTNSTAASLSSTSPSDPPVTLPGTPASTAVSPTSTSPSDPPPPPPPFTLPGTPASTAVSPSSTSPSDPPPPPPFTLPGTPASTAVSPSSTSPSDPPPPPPPFTLPGTPASTAVSPSSTSPSDPPPPPPPFTLPGTTNSTAASLSSTSVVNPSVSETILNKSPLATLSLNKMHGLPPTEVVEGVEGKAEERRSRNRKPAMSKEVQPVVWLDLAHMYLIKDLEDEKWKACVEQWFEFEKQTMSELDTNSRRLPAKGRPPLLSKWLSSRNYTAIPKLENEMAFGLEWVQWWNDVQPKWRKSLTPSTLPLSVASASAKDDISPIRKFGPTGLVMVLIGLKWWAGTRGTNGLWESAVADVVSCFERFSLSATTDAPSRKKRISST